MQNVEYRVLVHNEGDEGLWAEVEELPGCFASGDDLPDLMENLAEAISLYLAPAGTKPPEVKIQHWSKAEDTSEASEHRVLVCT